MVIIHYAQTNEEVQSLHGEGVSLSNILLNKVRSNSPLKDCPWVTYLYELFFYVKPFEMYDCLVDWAFKMFALHVF